MSAPAMIWIGYALIALNVAIVGLLIWRKRFGCFTPADREAIAKEVVRFMYEDRQAEMYRTLDELHRGRRNGREVDPKDFEEDCA